MWDKEMMAALEADGEKLRQLTGEDHGAAFVTEAINGLEPADVRSWLMDRLTNCQRHAAMRPPGKDRDGWLEDAAYFASAIGLIDWSAAESQ